jgi:phenylalanyl-tRNA synthetase beta chain
MPVRKPVTLRVARAVKVIGMALTQKQCADALRGLGFEVTETDGLVTVNPPSWRFDLEIEEDLIEEVARMVGYTQLPTTPPLAPITAKIRKENVRGSFAVRRSIAALGYQETINFSFVEERWENELAGNANPIKLLNPIASQMSVMRTSLLGSLLQVVKFNTDRKADRVRVFELGRVFLRDANVQNSDTTVEGFNQPMRVSGVAYGPVTTTTWGGKVRNVDFFDIKGEVEALLAPAKPVFEAAEHPAMHPGRCAQVKLNGQLIGHVGELHPRWRQSWDLQLAPILFELDLEAVLQREVPVAQGVARFQAVERDIAVIVAEKVSHAELMNAIHEAPTQGLLKNAVLFDVFRPQSTQGVEKSRAVRLTMNSEEATLTDVQIESTVKAVLDHLALKLSARLRS